MYIVPRTPMAPRRLSPITSPSSTISIASSQTILPHPLEKDVYDRFIDIYFGCDITAQSILFKTVTDYVRHPVYTHLLKTMDSSNAHYVMGYIRSQRSAKMYFILDHIIHNPIPNKQYNFQIIGQY